ncbi:MAG TPA: hypothetical protein DCE41_07685 [Cytophagales bacterium]|nr:hypothetical protein [Cytophagales bacterium]HAA24287.1 hypothetical protein [Cytophagales bacterium]HAP64340.1 hypothetical protein [Cytophagales bacterium]
MVLPKDTISHYRKGGWVHWARQDGDLFVHALAYDLKIPTGFSSHLAVAEAGVLTSYVAEISDLMWDVLEHTEKELWLVVPGGKNVPEGMLNAEGELSLHWSKKGPLHGLLYPTGKPGVVLRTLSAEESEQTLGALQNVVSLPPQKGVPDRRAMRMAPDGSVQLLE